MKPTVTLAETSTPDGDHLALIAHDGQFFLQLDGMPLQSSFVHGAAEHLARLACAPFRPVRQPRLLFAGLGLGYSLAVARAELPQKRGAFLVAEPEADLPAWHREFLADLHPGQLDDPRIQILSQDLTATLKRDREGFHAILLDASGSPPRQGVTDRKGLPVSSFLHLAHSALKEGGLLAIAFAIEGPTLERRLRQAGFDIARESVPASHKGKQKRLTSIWLARKGAYQKNYSR